MRSKVGNAGEQPHADRRLIAKLKPPVMEGFFV